MFKVYMMVCVYIYIYIYINKTMITIVKLSNISTFVQLTTLCKNSGGHLRPLLANFHDAM